MTRMDVYRSTAAEAVVGAQRRRLDLHRTSLETGTCQACGQDGPCPDANAAAEFLAERGLLLAEEGGPRDGAGPHRPTSRVRRAVAVASAFRRLFSARRG